MFKKAAGKMSRKKETDFFFLKPSFFLAIKVNIMCYLKFDTFSVFRK